MKKLISTVLCLFILLSCILPTMAATGVPEEVMESTKSVVRILSKYYNGAATGSGFVIKNEPGEVLIATNDHVVEGNPTSISIWVGEDRMVDAEIVFTTSEKDLCVLKVTDDVDMKPLKLSKEEPQHGAAIYVVGYPGAGDILSDTQAHTSESVTITDGIISAIRSFTIEKGGNPVKLLQVNAAINSGNSGGPLFDTEGVVVGVNTYKVNADSQGVFGSVAISELWSLLDQYGIEIPERLEVVEAEEEEVKEEASFLMSVLICAGAVGLILVMILIAKFRSSKTPRRKRRDLKVQAITLQTHMEKYPQGLGIGGAVSLLLPIAIQLRNLHNDGKLHLQICPENIIIGADGASLKDPSSQETGRFNSGFAAPEIYRGAGFGITSDIYSFAAVLLYATTGKVPANSLQQDALEQDFSLLDDVIFAQITRKAMASNILDRTQSMQELIYSIAVYNAPVQERQSQPLRTVETVPVSISEERPAHAPEKEETETPKHQKKTVPKMKHRKLLPIAAVLICGIVAVVLMWKPAEKQEETAQLQSTEQAETTVSMTLEEAAYAEAETLLADGEIAKAAIAFGKLAGYEDARQRSFSLWNTLIKRESIYCINGYFYGLKNDGYMVVAGKDEFGVSGNSDWKDVLQLVGGSKFGNLYQNDTCLLGLRSDGTVITAGQNEAGQCDVSDWTDIVKLWHQGARFYDSSKINGFWRYDYHNYVGMTVGLRADGTVVTTGSLEDVLDVSGWTDIVDLELSCSWDQRENTLIGGLLVGVRSDGTVVLTGNSIEDWMKEMETWTDIVDVCLGGVITGLRSDGTVVYTSADMDRYAFINEWKHVAALVAPGTALSDDGELLGDNHGLRGSMKNQWHNLAYVNDRVDIGLKADGTVVVDAFDSAPNGNVRNWTDVVAVSGWSANHGGHTIGIRSDGTVLAVGDTKYIGEVAGWTDIKLPDALLLSAGPKGTTPEEIPSDMQAQYNAAENLLAQGETAKAAIAFGKLGTYRDARERSFSLWDEIAVRNTICAMGGLNELGTAGLTSDGTVLLTGGASSKFPNRKQHWEAMSNDVDTWTDIIAIASGSSLFGLKADGSVNVAAPNGLWSEVEQWQDIVSISASDYFVLGLKMDGTVQVDSWKSSNDEENDRLAWIPELSKWTDIVAVSAGTYNAVGLRANGTVVVLGEQNREKYWREIEQWQNIITISTGPYGDTLGLKADGTLLSAGGYIANGDWDVSQWHNIVDFSVGYHQVLGVKSDGTVVAAGYNHNGCISVKNWTDIIAVDTDGNASGWHTVGLKSDGTLVAVGDNTYGQCNVKEWADIAMPGQLNSKPKEAPTDQQAQYDAAEKLLASGETAKAAIAFGKLGDYADARERSFVLWDEVAVRDTVAVGNHHTLGLKNNGTVVVAGQNIRHVGSAHRRQVFPMPQGQGQCDVGDWSDIIAVAATGTCSVGLRADGTVVGAGLIGSDESGEIWKEIESWQDIVSITVGNGVTGLKMDGTVVSTNLDLSDWADIVAISSGAVTVGLKADGTVLVAGNNYYKDVCNVEQWTDIVAIFAGNSSASGKAWTIGLQSDGTVVATGDNGDGQCNIEDWIDIRSISVSSWEKHITYGIKEDGTVLYAGKQSSWYNASKWEEIVCIAAGRNHAVGLKYDGTVVATGNTEFGRCDISGWTDIKLPN